MLAMLRSEIRVRTYNLLLVTYPAALTTGGAAGGGGKNDEATKVLTTALDTLVIVRQANVYPPARSAGGTQACRRNGGESG